MSELENTGVENTEVMESAAPAESTAGQGGAEHSAAPAATETSAEKTGLDRLPKADEVKPVVPAASAEGGVAPASYTPSTKFKAGDVEHEIPKEFQSLMKDAASEKQVKEIFEKAYGLDTVKGKLQSTRAERDKFATENRTLNEGIGELRTIYSKAVSSGNLHKLDQFFGKLDIPQDVILKYALAKVQLSEMPPEQRQLVESQLSAEQQAELAQKQVQQATTAQQQQMRELKAMQFEALMDKPDMMSIEKQYDGARSPGAFRRAIVQQGQMAWYQGENLSPAQAAQRVIDEHGLKASAAAPPAAPAEQGGGNPPVVVPPKTTATIPNVQGKSASPLKAKPKNVEEVLKLRKEKYGF